LSGVSRASQQIVHGRESAKEPTISLFREIEPLHEESRDCQTAFAGCHTSAAQPRRLDTLASTRGTMVTEHGLEKDRIDLKLATSRTLEDVAKIDAKPIIEANKEIWDQRQAAFERRYQKLLKGALKVGRHTRLDGPQLEAICPQNKTRFPAFWNIGPAQ
jgi:hypothetical protein